MDLAVVGAGFGRTGTISFKLALEQLGFGPCYHQTEAWRRPSHRRAWVQAVAGDAVDWHQLLAGFQATSDWPACSFWKQLKAANPDAKVVLLRRDPEAWYESISRTIFEWFDRKPPRAAEATAWRNAMRTLIIDHDLGGHTDRSGAIAALGAYETEVCALVPTDELLVYEVAQGWEPLCAFLDVEVPEAEFPHTNTTSQFRAAVGLDDQAAVASQANATPRVEADAFGSQQGASK